MAPIKNTCSQVVSLQDDLSIYAGCKFWFIYLDMAS